MRRVTICSKDYARELVDFYYNDEKEYVLKEGNTGGLFFFAIPERAFNAPLMMELMQGIILEKNAVISGSVPLFDKIKGLVFDAECDAQIAALRRYIREARRLNVEGYIHFRLRQYEDTLNGVLYAAVRKNLCVEY